MVAWVEIQVENSGIVVSTPNSDWAVPVQTSSKILMPRADLKDLLIHCMRVIY